MEGERAREGGLGRGLWLRRLRAPLTVGFWEDWFGQKALVASS
jgi:hypothetical protein